MTNLNSQKQYLTFLASFATAVGMAGTLTKVRMGERVTSNPVVFMMPGNALPKQQKELEAALGAFYSTTIKRDAQTLGSGIAETARTVYGNLVNDLVRLYGEFVRDNKIYDQKLGRGANLVLKGSAVTEVCGRATETITRLVNRQLRPEFELLLQGLIADLATAKSIRITLMGRNSPAPYGKENFDRDLVLDVVSRLRELGYEAQIYGSLECGETLPCLSASWPHEIEEGHPFGVRIIYREPVPQAA